MKKQNVTLNKSMYFQINSEGVALESEYNGNDGKADFDKFIFAYKNLNYKYFLFCSSGKIGTAWAIPNEHELVETINSVSGSSDIRLLKFINEYKSLDAI